MGSAGVGGHDAVTSRIGIGRWRSRLRARRCRAGRPRTTRVPPPGPWAHGEAPAQPAGALAHVAQALVAPSAAAGRASRSRSRRRTRPDRARRGGTPGRTCTRQAPAWRAVFESASRRICSRCWPASSGSGPAAARPSARKRTRAPVSSAKRRVRSPSPAAMPCGRGRRLGAARGCSRGCRRWRRSGPRPPRAPRRAPRARRSGWRPPPGAARPRRSTGWCRRAGRAGSGRAPRRSARARSRASSCCLASTSKISSSFTARTQRARPATAAHHLERQPREVEPALGVADAPGRERPWARTISPPTTA